MRILRLSFMALLASAFAAASAGAGPITSSIGGASSITVDPGTLVTVDNVITFGPSAVSGFGSGLEVSFDGASVATGGGAGPQGGSTVFPAGWVDLTGGAFTCDGVGFCDNIAAAANFGAPGFAGGATFAIASVVVDTTGLAPGDYLVGALLGAAGPDGILGAGGVDLSGEYSAVNATITIVPEPGTAALMGLGLGCLGIAGRRR